MSDEINFTTMTLTAQKFAAQQRMSHHVLQSIDIEQVTDMIANDLVFMLKAYVYGTSGKGRHVVSRQVPASWWQAFKAQAIADGNPFFRKVKTKAETFTVTADLFSWWPDMDIPAPEKWGTPVRIVTQTKGDWS